MDETELKMQSREDSEEDSGSSVLSRKESRQQGGARGRSNSRTGQGDMGQSAVNIQAQAFATGAAPVQESAEVQSRMVGKEGGGTSVAGRAEQQSKARGRSSSSTGQEDKGCTSPSPRRHTSNLAAAVSDARPLLAGGRVSRDHY